MRDFTGVHSTSSGGIKDDKSYKSYGTNGVSRSDGGCVELLPWEHMEDLLGNEALEVYICSRLT